MLCLALHSMGFHKEQEGWGWSPRRHSPAACLEKSTKSSCNPVYLLLYKPFLKSNSQKITFPQRQKIFTNSELVGFELIKHFSNISKNV